VVPLQWFKVIDLKGPPSPDISDISRRSPAKANFTTTSPKYSASVVLSSTGQADQNWTTFMNDGFKHLNPQAEDHYSTGSDSISMSLVLS